MSSSARALSRQYSQRSSRVANPQDPYSGRPTKSLVMSGRAYDGFSARNSLPQPLPPLKPPITYQSSSGMDSVRSSRTVVSQSEKWLRYESVVEAFLQNTATMPVEAAIEETLQVNLKADKVIFWRDVPSLHCLVSTRLSRMIEHSIGLVGHAFFSREIVRSHCASKHQAWAPEQDASVIAETDVVMLFPLWDCRNDICGIVEVTRPANDKQFDEDDDDFVNYFTNKFKLYSQWFFTPKFPHDDCLELIQGMELEQYLLVFQRKMHSLFACESAELWKYDVSENKMVRFAKQRTDVNVDRAGIVGEALLRNYPINCQTNKMQSSYFEGIDGSHPEPVIVVPLTDPRQKTKFAIALRGRQKLPIFTIEDELTLRQLAPYAITALDNAQKMSTSGNSERMMQDEHQVVEATEKLISLLTSGIPLDKIIETAVQECRKIVQADRAYLFFHDKEHDTLCTRVAIGPKNQLVIENGKGIVSMSFNHGKTINLPEAYDSTDFDCSFDLVSDYRTRSLASVPVLNNRGEVIAVGQFLNKRDGKPFSKNDLQYMKTILTFSGVMYENLSLYNDGSLSTSHVKSFIDSAMSLSSSSSAKAIISNIMSNARDAVNADRASLFLLDEVAGALSTYLADGGQIPQSIPLSHGIAALSVKQKESIIVNDVYHDPRFNKMIDYHTGFKTVSVITAPLVSSTNAVIGVVEMINKKEGIFTQEDLKMLQSFAKFASLTLENRQLKHIADRGRAEIEISKWIGEPERKLSTIPMKLRIDAAKQAKILCLNFFAIDWNGIGLFKIAFYVFDQFQLLETFKISSELFFRFLFKLRESYNEPPYHNWIHAIDVLQYFIYQIRTCGFDKVLTKLEMLSICVAAIAHDAGHEGFNNVYNVNAKTPLGILFKDQSVMETHHCTVIIRIISDPECNIFKAINESDRRRVWGWIIQMILATDMALHFKIVKNANDVMDQGPINLANDSHRVMAMTILMKVSDISNVSRPFEIADQWCDVLSEEFWRQGDFERERGLELSSPLNDRNGGNKAQGQIGFYNFICLPLYRAIARVFPELEVNVQAVESNLNRWKEILAEEQRKAQPPEPL